MFSRKPEKNSRVSPVNLGRVGLPLTRVFFILALLQMHKSPQNANANLSRGARGLIFGPSLPLLPYFVYARSGGSDKTVYAKACPRLHSLPM